MGDQGGWLTAPHPSLSGAMAFTCALSLMFSLSMCMAHQYGKRWLIPFKEDQDARRHCAKSFAVRKNCMYITGRALIQYGNRSPADSDYGPKRHLLFDGKSRPS